MIVERTPLRVRTLEEIRRVVKPAGWVMLRHASAPGGHPHLLARRLLPGRSHCALVRVGRRHVLQTTIRLEVWPFPPSVPLVPRAFRLV